MSSAAQAVAGRETATAMSFGVLAFGAAALTAAVALHQGWSPHLHRRQPVTSGESTAERVGRNLRESSARAAAAAGVWCDS